MPPQIEEIAAGLYHVVGPRTNWCLVRDDRAITLVDAGWPRDYENVADSLAAIEAQPDDVVAVVLTHAHRDHIGTAERFRTAHDATVHVHAAETEHATGAYEEHARELDLVVRLWRPSVLTFVGNLVRRGGLRHRSVGAVTSFGESRPLDVPGQLVPVPTPGHTRGHCAFYLPQKRAVITGDALVNDELLTRASGPRLLPKMFHGDWSRAVRSLGELAHLEADVLLPGHGSAMHLSAAEAVRQAMQRVNALA